MDSIRNLVSVTPGVINESTQHVYRHGQCLALACALAKETGESLILQLAPTGNGRVPVLVHAWAGAGEGRVVDIDGLKDQGGVQAEFWDGDVMAVYSADDVDEVIEAFSSAMPEQNLELAKSFTGPILTLIR
jgi:hypothetical protein